MSSFAEKAGEAVGRPIESAAGFRSRAGIWQVAIGAGIGAALGAFLIGGALGGGLGGGGGAALGTLLAMSLGPRGDPPVPAFGVLLVEPQHVVVCRQSMWSAKPEEELYSLPYEQIAAITTKSGVLSLRGTLQLVDGRAIELEAAKMGPAGGADAFRLVAERVESVRSAT